MKNNKIKIGAGVGAGALSASGLLAITLSLNSVTNAKIDNGIDKINVSAIESKAYMREYVKLSIGPIQTEIKHIQTEQTEIKMMIKDIHKYLFKPN